MSGKKNSTDAPKVYFCGKSRFPEPDQKVTELENRLVQAVKSNDLALKDLKLEDKLNEALDRDDWRTDLPRRPGFGSTGEPITLWTNYFHMKLSKGTFYRYAVNVSELPSEMDGATSNTGESSTATAARGSAYTSSGTTGSKNQARKKDRPSGKQLARIIELLLAHDDFAKFQNHIVSDFSATLLSTRELPRNPMVTTLQYHMEGESHVSDRAKHYKITVERTESFDLTYLQQYLESLSTYGAFENKEWFVQALNIFLRHHARTSQDITTLGRKAFRIDGGADELDFLHCLSALRGFYSSVRLATSRILVNVNISHSTFYMVSSRLAWRLHNFMDIFEEQRGEIDKKTKEQKVTKNPDYNLQNLEIFLQGLRVKICFQVKAEHEGDLVEDIKVRRINGLAHTDDGRELAYPPEVTSFGAGAKDVKFYDSPEVMNKTKAEIAEARRKKASVKNKTQDGVSGNNGTTLKRTPTNEYISVKDYVKLAQNTQYPVVNVGDERRPIYVNPFFCWVIPGQVYNPKLNPELMDRMLGFAVRQPADNASSIKNKAIDVVGLSPTSNPSLKTFGVEVQGPDLLTVKGRILVHPKVKYRTRDGTESLDADIRFAEWNMFGRNFYSTKPLGRWACLSITMGRFGKIDNASLKGHLDGFTKELDNCGLNFDERHEPKIVTITDEGDPRLEEKIRALAKDFDLLLVVLPMKHTLLYNKIKVFGDVKYGIHTVCVVGSRYKFFKGDPKYLANVAHKFNLKVGGINHVLEEDQLGIISEGKTMVVGYDVTHPAPGSNKEAPSIAAMVASIDKELAQWPADIYTNKAKKEMVDALGVMFESRLRLWERENGSLPENILIYRDGVSEGQYKTVLEFEVSKQLRPVCQKLYDPPLQKQGLPRITFIVVGKRHHTRFYPTTQYDTSNGIKQIDARTGNPVGGTVVDRGITEARNWDFFLQSHMAVQGTARPAHYIVLLDEIFKDRPLPEGKGFKNNADVLDNLTHNMCYLFGRATKAVSICPPAYYADIACERARRYLNRFYAVPDQAYNRSNDNRVLEKARDSEVKVHANLRNSMFYI